MTQALSPTAAATDCWRGVAVIAMLFFAVAPYATAGQRPFDLPPAQLQPGDWLWLPEAAPAGPLLLVVSIPEQKAYLYRNSVRIAVSTVSTGRAGNETPTGVYTILQKRREHYSNLYDDAPMPFMQRLTWGGVALHGGRLPGFPASHGCVRLPTDFAERLFGISELGMTVVVADENASIPGLARPGWLAPRMADARTATRADAIGNPSEVAMAEPPTEGSWWAPETSPGGPLTVLLSFADYRIRVIRNGVEIGRAGFWYEGDVPAGTRVMQLQAGTLPGESRHRPGQPRLNWTRLDIGTGSGPEASAADRYDGLGLPQDFVNAVYGELVPGTTVVLTDMPAIPGQSAMAVLETGPGPEEPPR